MQGKTQGKTREMPAPDKAPSGVSTGASRARRGELFSVECPSREVFRHVTSLWGVLALVSLRDGTFRFSELRRRVQGVSEKMLAQTLQLLEADGLVDRKAYPVVPPHVEYSLTPLGVEVAGRVAALADCIETNLPQVMKYQRRKAAKAQ
jgi:DNA-binding HxlR family transcriptional regulator